MNTITIKKPKRRIVSKHKRKAELTRAMLVEAFPACFSGKGADKRPLALNIHTDILAALPEIGFVKLTQALIDYTGGSTYLRNVVEGAPRIGIDGSPKGAVTAAEAEHAATRLAAFEAWAKSNKPEAEEARSNAQADPA